MSKPAPGRRGAGGQSLVELAIILPVLLTLLMGAVEVGRMAFAQTALEEAVEEGTTYAAHLPGDAAGIISRVRSSSNHPEVASATVAAPTCTAQTITITATYSLPMVTPLGRTLFGQGFSLAATVVGPNLKASCA